MANEEDRKEQNMKQNEKKIMEGSPRTRKEKRDGYTDERNKKYIRNEKEKGGTSTKKRI